MILSRSRIVVATLAGAIFLFLFDGALQALPGWGIRAVERIQWSTTGEVNTLPAMAYLMSPNQVQFIATQPAGYYNPIRFFTIEAFSALLIAGIMAVLFARLAVGSLRQRISLAFLFSLIACLAIHLPYANWWGFSLPYTAGVMVKTIIGMWGVAYLQNRWIYRINA